MVSGVRVDSKARSGWLARLAASRGVYYGWLVVAVTFLVLLVAAGVRALAGIVIKPLEGEFGWDRASISLAIAVSLVAMGWVALSRVASSIVLGYVASRSSP